MSGLVCRQSARPRSRRAGRKLLGLRGRLIMKAHCEYVTNYVNRRAECGYLMLAAVGLASAVTFFVSFIASKVGLKEVSVALLSPPLIYGGLLLAWDNWVWRIASRFGYPLPNLNGEWSGHYRLRSSPDVHRKC